MARLCLRHALLSQLLALVLQVYAVYFKCNKHLIREYPNLKNYTAEIYQMPGEHVYHSLTHLVILTIMISIIDMTGVNKEIDMTGVNNNKEATSHIPWTMHYNAC